MNLIMNFAMRLQGRQDLALVAVLLVAIAVMIIPIPTVAIDALIAFNISITILILMVSVYIKRATDFGSFPAIILLATTFRLALSIATTRTVLMTAEGGAIIETFGNFVTGGNIVVGLVIFLIITIVQFVVITKGAERVAEVAARFVLDALPGRQLSIDSEARAGDITAVEARQRRRHLDKENQFFGAMDGAMKFVKGDAIAGLLIIIVNLIGGISIGTSQMGMSVSQSAHTFSLLTIGDGLVAQIPALLVALCSGAVVTRVASETPRDLGREIAADLGASSQTLFVAAGVIGLIGWVPGFPLAFFLAFSMVVAFIAFRIQNRLRDKVSDAEASAALAAQGEALSRSERLAGTTMQGERMIIKLGTGVAARINATAFGRAREAERDASVQKLGVELPRFGLSTDAALAADQIRIDLDSVPLKSFTVAAEETIAKGKPELLAADGRPHQVLDLGMPDGTYVTVKGISNEDLAGLDFEIVPLEAMILRLALFCQQEHFGDLIGFEEITALYERLKALSNKLATQAEQIVGVQMITDVLRRLIDEKVPLVAPRGVFETLITHGPRESDTAVLTEHTRAALRRQISNQMADNANVIHAHIVDPALESELRKCLQIGDVDTFFSPTPPLTAVLLEGMAKVPPYPVPVVVTSADLRRHLRSFLLTQGIRAHIISFQEIASECEVYPVGMLSAQQGPPDIADAA